MIQTEEKPKKKQAPPPAPLVLTVPEVVLAVLAAGLAAAPGAFLGRALAPFLRESIDPLDDLPRMGFLIGLALLNLILFLLPTRGRRVWRAVGMIRVPFLLAFLTILGAASGGPRGGAFAGGLAGAVLGVAVAVRYGTPLLPRYARGVAYFNRGQYDRAVADMNAVLRRRPRRARAYLLRGAAWHMKKDHDRALADCEAAARLAPRHPDFLHARAVVRSARHDYEPALADLDEALRLKPNHVNTLYTLCRLRAACPDEAFRDGKQAVQYGYQACELTRWGNPVVLGAYAAAFAELGDFDKAQKFQQRALDLVKKRRLAMPPDEFAKAEQRLEMYERGEPYRLEE
jgi:tetratricopeptide (TPR) repeat protein